MIRHVHASGRFDRSPTSLWAALRIYMSQFFGMCNLVTFTEVSDNRRASRLRWLGWQRVQSSEGGGRDECALMYSRLVWKLVDWRAVQISRSGLPSRGGQKVWALEVVLKHRRNGRSVTIIVVHLPAHLDNSAQLEVWYECTDWLAVWGTIGNVIITGDFNVDFLRGGRVMVRRILRAGLTLNWSEDRTTSGTYKHRLIDGTLTNLTVVKASVMAANSSSDHRPFKEVLKW